MPAPNSNAHIHPYFQDKKEVKSQLCYIVFLSFFNYFSYDCCLYDQMIASMQFLLSLEIFEIIRWSMNMIK